MWLALVGCVALAAILALTVGASREASVEDRTLRVGLRTCEQFGAPVPLMRAAMVNRGWVVVSLNGQLRLVAPHGGD